ncbi:MAG: TetR family transcriptional regulator [Actinomycetota bacterium]|nr:TetR family transcriptional regulator [Actinomycetota bacterium]
MSEVDVPVESAWAEKKRVTRAALRRAALTLVGERGLGRVTVEEIAAAAGVSTRTFFNYFPTKEDAVIGWDPSVLADMAERLRRRPRAEPALAALRSTLLEVLSPGFADHRDLLLRLQVTRGDPHLVAHQVLRFGDTERELVGALAERRGLDPAHDRYASLVVAAVLAVGRAALMAWCDDAGQSALADVLAGHLDVLAGGLAEPQPPV